MLDQLKPVSNWEYIFLFLLALICFLIGYFFARRYYKGKLQVAIDDCTSEKDSLRNQLMVKQAEVQSEAALRNQQKTVAKKAEAVKEAVEEKVEEKTAPSSLNFESFGKADASQKDDLKKISGVGPFIEKKLNGIGIYTFDQISKFSKKDIDDVTDLIKFFPGRIERDDWVGQAGKLK